MIHEISHSLMDGRPACLLRKKGLRYGEGGDEVGSGEGPLLLPGPVANTTRSALYPVSYTYLH